MAKIVKRSYDSTKRRQQAEVTRRAILDAARDRFLNYGYGATTIQSVADDAGVAVQTVYAVFKNKRRLLDELIEASITGDEPDDFADIANEPDPRRRAELDAAATRAITERVAPIARIARDAAASDPEFAVVFAEMKARRRADMAAMTKIVAGPNGHLRMRGEMAAAAMYVLYSPDVADMLMGDYGWSPARYEKWLAHMLYSCLLAP